MRKGRKRARRDSLPFGNTLTGSVPGPEAVYCEAFPAHTSGVMPAPELDDWVTGVHRSVAMKLTGFKTESVHRCYAIAGGRNLRVAVERLNAIVSSPNS